MFQSQSDEKLRKLEAFLKRQLAESQFIKRFNSGELSEQESLFFAYLNNRLSNTKLVLLEREIALLTKDI